MPDHFDRLVAKGGPGGDRAGVRVRPRLPGPFERLDALAPALPVVGEESFGPGRPVGRPAPVPLPRPPAAPPARVERALRAAEDGERTTVAPVLPLPRTPLLIAPPATPVVAPAVEPAVRREAARPAAAPAPVTAPHRAAARELPNAAPPAPARPAVAARAAGRRAAGAVAPGQAHPAGARRQQRPVERVVRVQIGRVEVRAAERAAAGERKPAAARPGPALDLDTYLNRGTA
ncbi:hypothetical protein ACIRD3_05840 [Kitasatospora sp. NPDC093550]|uniref:hypothetical protein n=1 Tax=Kitasatospora sp. NPDC093550 TaxID=3364089 RepID=UPI003827F29F